MKATVEYILKVRAEYEEQAKILGKLYNAHSSYFNDEAIQLDLLITKIEIIKALKAKINSLESLNK